MQKKLILFLFFSPLLALSQFDDNELYIYGRFNVDIGMRNFTYVTTLDGLVSDDPIIGDLKLGSGFTHEIGVGLMILDHFFIESNLEYTITQRNGYKPEGSIYYIDKYKFNRTRIGVNGVYFVDIDNYITMYGSGGIRAVLPHVLEVTTSHGVETINYQATVGYIIGFGGNWNVNKFVYGIGLHYQMETFKVAPNQDIYTIEANNPEIRKLKIRSMVLSLSAKYLF